MNRSSIALKVRELLLEQGFDRQQADALALVLDEVYHSQIENVATKDDIKSLIQMLDKRFQEQLQYMNKRFEDMNKRFEATDKKFEEQLHYIDKRFEAIDKKFEEQLHYIDKRFEAIDKKFEEQLQYVNTRFEDMNKRFEAIDKRFEELVHYLDKRFEDMNKRFEDLNKRFTFTQWLIVLLFTAYTGIVSFVITYVLPHILK